MGNTPEAHGETPRTAVNPRRGRGQQKRPTKRSVTIRLSPEVIEHFRQQGRGWQTRLNDFLLEKISEDPPEQRE